MQAKRHFVERAFRDAKQELGMDQYRVRGYAAWHTDMALVIMAQLFIQQGKVLIDPNHVALSTQDIVNVLIALVLPQTKLVDIIQQINIKNKTLFAKIRYLNIKR